MNLTINQKLYLTAAGVVLSLLVMFVLYPPTHPDLLVKEFTDKDGARSAAGQFLSQKISTDDESDYRVEVHRDRALIAFLTENMGRRAVVDTLRKGRLEKWPAYLWRVQSGDDVMNILAGEGILDFSQDSEVEFTLELNSGFNLLSFEREDEVHSISTDRTKIKLNRFKPDWRLQIGAEQDTLKITVEPDLNVTEFGSLDDGVSFASLARDFFLFRAEEVLSQTFWGDKIEAFEPADLQVTENMQIRIKYETQFDGLDQDVDVNLTFSPGGELNKIEYATGLSDPSDPDSIISGIGAGLATLLVFIVFVGFARRYYARLIDARGSLTDGLFAMVLIFLMVLIPTFDFLFQNRITQWYIPLIILAAAMLTAFFSAILIYILSANGASLIHEVWPKKGATLTFARRGFWLNRPVGKSLLTGIAAGTIIAGVVYVMMIFLDSTGLYFESRKAAGMYISPFTNFSELLGNVFFALFWGWLILCNIGPMSFMKRQNWKITGTLLMLIFSCLNVLVVPADSQLLLVAINLITGAFFLGLLIKTDILVVFTSVVMLRIWHNAVDTIIPFGMLSGYGILYLLLVIGCVAIAFYALKTGPDIYDLPEIVPEYILEHARRERIERELEIARQVQTNFLPTETPNIPGLDVVAQCTPAFEVGGDYYDFIRLDEHRTALLIGDVSGKGIHAAFYMTLVKGFIRSLCRDIPDPEKLISKVNGLFRENVPKGNFITMLYGVYDSRDLTFKFVRAGHDPLLVKSGKTIRLLQPEGLPLGMAETRFFDENIAAETIKLGPGDVILMFTDGITETRNRRGDFFGENRIRGYFETANGKNAQDLSNGISEEVEKFRGNRAMHDDMTMIVMVVKQELPPG